MATVPSPAWPPGRRGHVPAAVPPIPPPLTARAALRLLSGLLALCAAATVALMGAVAPASAEPLPDGRVYELVSPLGDQDADVYTPSPVAGLAEHGISTELAFEAAANGDAVAYVASPTSSGNGNGGTGGGNQYLATRSPGSDWTQSTITPQYSSTAQFEAFSSDLSVGIVDGGLGESTPLSAEVTFGRYNMLYAETFADGVYRPFFTNKPPNRVRFEFGTAGISRGAGTLLAYAGSSANLGHLLFEANDALTENAVDPGEEANNLYDSVGGQLHLVNVLPDGSTEPNATFGAPKRETERSEYDWPDFSNVISEDGSRVFWTDLNTNDLYVRENDAQPQSPLGANGECTVPGDACTVLVAEDARFWTAAADGSQVIFTKAGDLYAYDFDTGATTDLAPGGEVQGVLGASADGEYVYFAGDGVLASGATAGQPNLYLAHDGAVTFIATLSPKDGREVHPAADVNNSGSGDWVPSLGHRMAEVTPDGHNVVFVSELSLTGYPSEKGFEEIYLYSTEDGGRLSCVSCAPNGAPPPLPEGDGGYLQNSYSFTYMARVISEDGSRVFFTSPEPLVPQDINGVNDVYEWERDGAGSCERSGGCVFLLSSGTSTEDSYFLDASANGDDMFMITRAQLVPQDREENFKVYDVSADGIHPIAPPACSGSGCQGVPGAPPVFATPSSVTFNGVGNFLPGHPVVRAKTKPPTRAQRLARALRACRAKRSGHRRAACEARARRSYGRSRASKSTMGRR
jgi:hypothetical protein